MMISVKEAARRAGRPNVRAFREYVVRHNRRHPSTPILTGRGTVDEASLQAAIDRDIREHTPFIGAKIAGEILAQRSLAKERAKADGASKLNITRRRATERNGLAQ